MPTQKPIIGDTRVTTITCKTVDDVLTDPTTLVVTTQVNNATPTVYTYPASSEIVKESTGVFEFTWPAFATAGSHRIYVVATGAVAAAEADVFTVHGTTLVT